MLAADPHRDTTIEEMTGDDNDGNKLVNTIDSYRIHKLPEIHQQSVTFPNKIPLKQFERFPQSASGGFILFRGIYASSPPVDVGLASALMKDISSAPVMVSFSSR